MDNNETKKIKNRAGNAHYSGIGGQAVIEGVMMKNKDRYAVAVRTPEKDINISIEEYEPFGGSGRIVRLPFIRGVFSFIDSLIIGIRTLNYSASFYEEEDVKSKKRQKKGLLDKIFGENAEKAVSGLTVCLSVVFAIGLFMLLPYYLSVLLRRWIVSELVISIAEGVLRIFIFIGYLLAISLMEDIRRTFMYHGAEHKCINCIETGNELNVQNVLASSRQHKRCGTSFMFLVVFVSIIFFMFIRAQEPILRVAIRILLIPVIAGVSYEIIRLAGRSDNIFVKIISAPGLLLQKLTTREPDAEMVEVAIASVEAVFDWRAYLLSEFGVVVPYEEEKDYYA
ncbi:MAG: DUF1385 domain-containing protein [Lachnospiraceae bacterium]|nr:DUF1385 domain-containing protein [Lachnospiraceae bacterium]